MDSIDELFSDLDAGIATLERVQTKLKIYRASVLKAAVDGALTTNWRRKHPATEPASVYSRASSPSAAVVGKKPSYKNSRMPIKSRRKIGSRNTKNLSRPTHPN